MVEQGFLVKGEPPENRVPGEHARQPEPIIVPHLLIGDIIKIEPQWNGFVRFGRCPFISRRGKYIDVNRGPRSRLRH